MNRRHFCKDTSLVSAGISVLPAMNFLGANPFKSDIRMGVIGVGARGLSTLELLLDRNDVTVTAICDVDDITLAKAQGIFELKAKKAPKVYKNGPYDYRNLLSDKLVDAVIIATPWEWHTPMSIDAMKAGIITGCEVSGAMSIDECWQMVHTYESTQTPFMILENVCYRRDVMAVLNMVREGLFGTLIHLEGGYEHDLRKVKFNDGKQYYGGGVEFGEKGYSEAQWRTNHSVHRNGDLYPTHGIGPISNMLNINRGNRFEYLISMASKSAGLHDYILQHPQGGEQHPNADVVFRLGDVVTTQIKTANGETIILTHDTNLPRPYSLGFRVQGTRGIWMDVNKSIYIEGLSPEHKWEPADTFLQKYDHSVWRKLESQAKGAGHGGMDYFILQDFIEAIKNNNPMPLDVYDFAAWAAITCLSEQSIATGSSPQTFPDFTGG